MEEIITINNEIKIDNPLPKKFLNKKELKKNLFLLGITILVMIIFFEIFLRFSGYTNYGFQKGVFVNDESIGYKLSPNYSGYQSVAGKGFFLKTNNLGLRDYRDYSMMAEDDRKRVVLLGDSFAFGNGMDLNETFAEILRQKFGENVDIINFGVPGYDINNEYMIYEWIGKKYNPDLVIVQFTTNDWNQKKIIEENEAKKINLSQVTRVNSMGFLVSSNSTDGTLRKIHLSLLYGLKTYSFVYSNLRESLNSLVKSYFKRQIPLEFSDPNSDEYLSAYEFYSSTIKALKEETNGNLFIFLGPFEDEITGTEKLTQYYDTSYPIDPYQTKRDVKKIAEELNVALIELKSNESDIYIPLDGHWNAKGHKEVAETLYPKIKEFFDK